MNANEIKQFATSINQEKNREDMIRLIEPIVIKIGSENREIGRNQILNHFSTEIQNLRS